MQQANKCSPSPRPAASVATAIPSLCLAWWLANLFGSQDWPSSSWATLLGLNHHFDLRLWKPLGFQTAPRSWEREVLQGWLLLQNFLLFAVLCVWVRRSAAAASVAGKTGLGAAGPCKVHLCCGGCWKHPRRWRSRSVLGRLDAGQYQVY